MALIIQTLCFSFFVCASVVVGQCPVGVSVCEKIYRNECSVDACNKRIASLVNDESQFWFGSDYDFTCNGADPTDRNSRPECYNPETDRNNKRSIAQRLFGRSLDASQLQKFIEIKFFSQATNYTACGGQFDKTFRAFDVHPEMVPVEPWFIRSAPEQLYITPTPREIGTADFYTVLFIDAGYGTLHGLFVDLNDQMRAVLPWQPPLAVANHTNPIVAIAYKQPSKGYFIEPRWLMTMKSDRLVRQMFDLNDFVTDHNLIGPVGLNWIPITSDAYSANLLRTRGTADTCLAYVKQRVLQSQSTTTTGRHHNDFLLTSNGGAQLAQLNSYLTVRFVVPPSSFSVCCQSYRFAQNTFNVNALNNLPTDAINVRIKPASIGVRQTVNNNISTFANKFYTLIAVNADVVNNAVATPFQPMTVYMLINAPGANDAVDFDVAQEILPWERPVPAPKSPGERVWFLLYEQPQQFEGFSRNNISAYADSSCGYELKDRCLFRLNQMAQDLQLVLRGITWFDVVSDPFARYVLIKSGQAEWNVCAYIPGYSRPCPSQIQLNKNVVALQKENEIQQAKEKVRGDDLDRLTAAEIGREPRRDGANRMPFSILLHVAAGGLWCFSVFGARFFF